MLKVKAHVHVSGRVQGVFFRSETRDEAVRHAVTGWVRNLPDGRVEAVFEGEKENVDKLVEFCGRGPRGARITKVEVAWETYTGEFKNFQIRSRYWRY
ncbi:MAG: acylphosphatase [Candidatus Bathyarchaeota archaeon]|jgi:acylphosphatase